jgi:hypothetical protein
LNEWVGTGVIDIMSEVEVLMVSKARAAKHLECSVEELKKWVKPDRILDDRNPATRGMLLWSGATLNAAKPHIAEWREKDKRESERLHHEHEAQRAAQSARRKGMKKAGALLISRVCEILQCSKTELNRWAQDGRMPPDGEIHLSMAKSVNARAWLPATVEDAKSKMDDWRKKDNIAKFARRRKPSIVRR